MVNMIGVNLSEERYGNGNAAPGGHTQNRKNKTSKAAWLNEDMTGIEFLNDLASKKGVVLRKLRLTAVNCRQR